MTDRSEPRGTPLAILAVAVAGLVLVASPAAAAPALAVEPPRLALLVGISDYQQQGRRPWNRLNTHQDVSKLRDVLVKRHGFQSADVVVLEDQHATRKEIEASFRRNLIGRAQPGSVVVFHFSGHGQQLADDSGDEVDGLDESLVPYDATEQDAGSNAETNIRDDTLGQWLSELGKKMEREGRLVGSINVFLDSCFSGTATRAGIGSSPRGRAWDSNLDGVRPVVRPSVPLRDLRIGTDGLDGIADAIILSAGDSSQRALERAGMGVFSAALIRALERADSQTTYQELHDDVSIAVAAQTPNQSPVLEGPPTSLLFAGTGHPRQSYIPVGSLQGPIVTLGAGRLQLLEVGAVVEIHPRGTAPMRGATRLATAELFEVTPFSSKARVLGNTKLDPVQLRGARAIVIHRGVASAPLKLALAEDLRLPGLAEQLQQLDMVQLVSPAASDVDLRVDRVGSELTLRANKADDPLRSYEATELGVLALKQAVAARWRYRQLLSLHNDDSFIQVKLRLAPVHVVVAADGRVHLPPTLDAEHPPSTHLQLDETDCFQLELENLAGSAVYVQVLALTPDGQILHLYPNANQPDEGKLAPGQTIIPPLPYVYQASPPIGRSVLKVIATSAIVDLRALAYSSECGRDGLQQGPKLTSLLALLRSGAQRLQIGRNREDQAEYDGQGQWSVSDSFMTVRPAGTLASDSAAAQAVRPTSVGNRSTTQPAK